MHDDLKAKIAEHLKSPALAGASDARVLAAALNRYCRELDECRVARHGHGPCDCGLRWARSLADRVIAEGGGR
jgi:hypothetical protein